MSAQNPLSGKRVLVTRPVNQAGQLADLIRKMGGHVELMPLISITPPKSWKEFDAAIKDISQYGWIIFASTNAVEMTIERIKCLKAMEAFRQLKIACVGKSTSAALHEYGLTADLLPREFVAESLIREFEDSSNSQTSSSSNKKVLWPKTNKGRLLIKDDLEKLGWSVNVVEVYNTEGPADPTASANKLKELLQKKGIDIITLTSSETVVQLDAISQLCINESGSPEYKSIVEMLRGIKLAVIGPETAKTCKTLFGRFDIQAKEYTVAGLVQAICADYSDSGDSS